MSMSSAHAKTFTGIQGPFSVESLRSRGSRKTFQRKGERTDPCGVERESVFEATPPLKLSEVTLLERKLAIILR